MQHITREDPNYLIEIQTDSLLHASIIVSKVTEKAKTIYGLLDWVTLSGITFNVCEKEQTRKYTFLKDISTQTHVHYLMQMVLQVEKEISLTLPNSFGIMIDSWSETSTSTHYLGIFAVFPEKKKQRSHKHHCLHFRCC